MARRWPRRWRRSRRSRCRRNAWPGDTLPGLGAWASSRQASCAAAATSAGSSANRAASGHAGCVAAAPSRPRAGHGVIHDRPGHVHARGALQPLPPGNAVDLEDEHVTVAIHAADPRPRSRPRWPRRRESPACHSAGASNGTAAAPRRDVRAPVARHGTALDGGQHLAADHEQAVVAAAVVDRALHVEHGARGLERLDDAKARRRDR